MGAFGHKPKFCTKSSSASRRIGKLGAPFATPPVKLGKSPPLTASQLDPDRQPGTPAFLDGKITRQSRLSALGPPSFCANHYLSLESGLRSLDCLIACPFLTDPFSCPLKCFDHRPIPSHAQVEWRDVHDSDGLSVQKICNITRNLYPRIRLGFLNYQAPNFTEFFHPLVIYRKLDGRDSF